MYISLEAKNIIHQSIIESINNIQASLGVLDKIEQAAKILVSGLNQKNKILICGNGGSAADAQHMAAEIIGRFEVERKSLPAIALNTDTSILTAVGNDYGFEHIFSRQVQGLGNEKDILIAISTSGNSKNIIKAIEAALQKNMQIIAFTGKNGGKIEEILQNSNHINLIATGSSTARIQEVHGIWIHVLCQIIDKYYK